MRSCNVFLQWYWRWLASSHQPLSLRAVAVATEVVVAALCAILFSRLPRPRQIPFENRIPAPLAAPAQAPVINGPMSQPSFRGMTGIGQ